jgi:iron complex outermembrane receptor protein
MLASVAMAQEGTYAPSQPLDRFQYDEQGTSDGENDGANVMSQHDDYSDLSLEELMEVQIVVTAARREQKITTVPYAVSVISAEDIRRSGAQSIPDALRLVPGVDVAQLSFAVSAVSPRGLHGFYNSQVLVLVDGRQIFDSLFGGTLWASWPFQLEDIERIEVIRGPGGVTWGANAVNGVINIITKDPADQPGLTFTAGGGSRGWHKEHFGYAFTDDKLRMRISGEYEAGDGFKQGGSVFRRLDDDFKVGRLGIHGVYEASLNDTFTFSAGSSVLDGGYSPPSFLSFRTTSSGSQANFVLGKWTHEITEHNRFELTGYVNDFQISLGIPAVDYRYQQLAVQFAQTFQPAPNHAIAWGVDSRVDLTDASNADPFMLTRSRVSSATVGLYLQDEWRFRPKWTLNWGGRIDYDSYGGFEPSGRLALSYELTENSMIWGAVSRAFQMPPAALRFVDLPLVGGLGHVKGDRSMKATGLVGCELGYRARVLDRLETSVNVFWHEYNNIGAFSPTLGPPGLLRVDVDSRASASVYGLELDARYRATEKLILLGNYTFERMDWRSSIGYALGTDYISPPKHKFMLGARYSPSHDLHLSGHLYYVDAVRAGNPLALRRVDPYFRLDLKGEYQFWNDQASIAVGVRNLLDPEHYEGSSSFLNYTEVPRMIFAELRLRIK